jgi:hypothetical protein
MHRTHYLHGCDGVRALRQAALAAVRQVAEELTVREPITAT